MKTAAGATINYTYDGLKRLQMAAATSGSATVLTTKYAYRDINGTQTTAQPQYYKVIQGNGDGLSSANDPRGRKVHLRRGGQYYEDSGKHQPVPHAGGICV